MSDNKKISYRLIFHIELALSLLVAGFGCTDAHLYGLGGEDPSANRLAISGQVCTDDPKEAGFPVKVVFVVDSAFGFVQQWDPQSERIQAIRDIVTLHAGNAQLSFAVVSMGPNASIEAPFPGEGFFTRNPGELDNALTTLLQMRACQSGICRSYQEGVTAVRSLVEGDMADLTAGERSRTQYAVVFMAAGPPDPLPDPDPDCTDTYPCAAATLAAEVLELREDVEGAGPASFSFHTIHLGAADPLNPDVVESAGTQRILQEMAFSGAGHHDRFDTPEAIVLDKLGLTKISSLLQAKALIVSNANVLPGGEFPILDSDGDGLPDSVEEALGTDPNLRDSDGDSLSDMVEAAVSFNPLEIFNDGPPQREGVPTMCLDDEVDGPPWLDEDADRLNFCEEKLLGTNPTLPDTDGDGIPDWMEVVARVDYLRADSLEDADKDGASNGDEVKNHTDPRSSDASSHLSGAYRYEIEDDGFVNTPSFGTPRRATGITFIDGGADITPGVSELEYLPGNPTTLRWRDASDQTYGETVAIDGTGEYILYSPSVAEGLERWVKVGVDEALLAPELEVEFIVVEMSERHCLSYTVRNIRLMETTSADGVGGVNNIFVYFAQSPVGRLTLPGLFRVVHIPVIYHPDTGREPADLVLTVKDEEFVSTGF